MASVITIRTIAAICTPPPESAICVPVHTTTINERPRQSCSPASSICGATMVASSAAVLLPDVDRIHAVLLLADSRDLHRVCVRRLRPAHGPGQEPHPHHLSTPNRATTGNTAARRAAPPAPRPSAPAVPPPPRVPPPGSRATPLGRPAGPALLRYRSRASRAASYASSCPCATASSVTAIDAASCACGTRCVRDKSSARRSASAAADSPTCCARNDAASASRVRVHERGRGARLPTRLRRHQPITRHRDRR